MDSIQLPPPIILVCPSLRYKCSSRTNYDRHAKFKIVDSPHYYPFAVPESSLPYSYFGHLLNPLYWYNNKVLADDLDPVCATKPSFMNYHKRHEHTLYHFPRKADLICDVCGVVDSNALQVCNSERLWDEKELEEEPEEEYENLNSFEVISAGIIQHFSHSHHMKFEKTTTDIMYDERCHACVLPFYGGDIYKCMKSKCDFVLHEACANLPRTKQHITHPYPFILQTMFNVRKRDIANSELYRM
ncbi:hypothetical protein YC2023_050194 [Brassica napus]